MFNQGYLYAMIYGEYADQIKLEPAKDRQNLSLN